MAGFNKFHSFSLNLGEGNFDFASDTLKIALTNTGPNASTNDDITDITQIANGNGYTTGGASVPNVAWDQSAGLATLSGDAVVFEADGGSMGTFRYAVLYDATTGFLIGYWDYGSAVTITDGNTFSVLPNNDATDGTFLTV